jgi:hypothetical protein
MRYKTLVIGKGTIHQEFFGYESEMWVTSSSPVHIMMKDITWEDVKSSLPERDWEGIELVTIEIKVVEDE